MIPDLTPAELERLALLAEEMGESIQIIGKILRHGYESHHPDGGPTNRELLEKELGDVVFARRYMEVNGDISEDKIIRHCVKKSQTVFKYLHHQEAALRTRSGAE